MKSSLPTGMNGSCYLLWIRRGIEMIVDTRHIGWEKEGSCHRGLRDVLTCLSSLCTASTPGIESKDYSLIQSCGRDCKKRVEQRIVPFAVELSPCCPTCTRVKS